MAQAAYDISVFENRAEKKARQKSAERQGEFKVVRQNKWQRVTKKLATIKLIAMTALGLSLAWGVIYSQVQVVEISANIDSTNFKLEEAVSEYNYLTVMLESKTNLKKVEEVASQQLGLLEIDKSQITYLTLEDENLVIKPEGKFEDLVSEAGDGLMNLVEYIVP